MFIYKSLTRFRLSALAIFCATAIAAPSYADEFSNWESPHVHPIDITPDTSILVAVNTADHRLEVFDIENGMPAYRMSIPVGLDPVTVRVRNDNEAWVINHISDSISVVDLSRGIVVKTIQTEDEPSDVIFSSNGRAFVTCSQDNSVLVFDADNLSVEPQRLAIAGEDPRGLAISPDGNTVYAAIFESGNASTIINGGRTRGPNGVDSVLSPYGGVNPPPNDGDAFNPPLNVSAGTPPRVGMIVKKDSSGNWMDDNDKDWTDLVSGDNSSESGRVSGWDLADNDVAIIDTDSLAVTYQSGLMNMVMGISVNPRTGRVTTVGTEAHNEVRFEPNLRSKFLTVRFADFPSAGGETRLVDLNSHLDTSIETIPVAQRLSTVGDPRTITWGPSGLGGYVTGMGSNNLAFLSNNGTRRGVSYIPVGQGPTGVVYGVGTGSVFVLNRFDASISVIQGKRGGQVVAEVPFFDPTPVEIINGRPLLYDTHAGSGLGQSSCGSCHVDARADRLAWNLGNPAGELQVSGGVNWHPMKGPMRTTSLIGLDGAPSLHFRGDRDDITDFSGAFHELQGLDKEDEPSNDEMLELSAFLNTILTPPNPYRNLDNSLPTSVTIPGADLRVGDPSNPSSNCYRCHSLDEAGRDGVLRLSSGNMPGGTSGVQPAISPSLRSMYEIFGLDFSDATASTAGFGFIPDGSFDLNTQNTLQNNNSVAFMMTFNGDLPGDTHAAVGKQVTEDDANNAEEIALLAQLLVLAQNEEIGLIAKGLFRGSFAGFVFDAEINAYRTTYNNNTWTHAQLLRHSGSNTRNLLTFTAVPYDSRIRMGVDRDDDGVYNEGDSLVGGEIRLLQNSNLGIDAASTGASSASGGSMHMADFAALLLFLLLPSSGRRFAAFLEAKRQQPS